MIHAGRIWAELTRAERHAAVREREAAKWPATKIAAEFGVTKGTISGVHNQLKAEAGRKLVSASPRVVNARPAKAAPAPKPPKEPKPVKRAARAVLVGGMLMPTPSSGPKPNPNDIKGRAEQRKASPGISAHHAKAFKPVALPASADAKQVHVEPVTLMGLKPKCCKWPVGGHGADMLFCARPTDGLYCVSHANDGRSVSREPAPSHMRSAPRLRHQT